MFSLGRAEQEASRGRKGGDVQWQQEVGLRRLKEILGLGRELWGSLAHSLAWTGTLSRCGEKKMGLDPNQGHHHVWNK